MPKPPKDYIVAGTLAALCLTTLSLTVLPSTQKAALLQASGTTSVPERDAVYESIFAITNPAQYETAEYLLEKEYEAISANFVEARSNYEILQPEIAVLLTNSERLVKIQPQNYKLAFNYGRLLLLKGLLTTGEERTDALQAAEKMFIELTKNSPFNPVAYWELAKTQSALNNQEAALRTAETAYELNPESTASQNVLDLLQSN